MRHHFHPMRSRPRFALWLAALVVGTLAVTFCGLAAWASFDALLGAVLR